MRKLSGFEQTVLACLTNPPLAPKFQLWQTVRCQGYQNHFWTGQICGFHFERVEVAFKTSADPGWYYHLESGENISIVHEDDIDGVVGTEEPETIAEGSNG